MDGRVLKMSQNWDPLSGPELMSCALLCVLTLILSATLADGQAGNAARQHHLDSIDRGPTWGPTNRARLGQSSQAHCRKADTEQCQPSPSQTGRLLFSGRGHIITQLSNRPIHRICCNKCARNHVLT